MTEDTCALLNDNLATKTNFTFDDSSDDTTKFNFSSYSDINNSTIIESKNYKIDSNQSATNAALDPTETIPMNIGLDPTIIDQTSASIVALNPTLMENKNLKIDDTTAINVALDPTCQMSETLLDNKDDTIKNQNFQIFKKKIKKFKIKACTDYTVEIYDSKNILQNVVRSHSINNFNNEYFEDEKLVADIVPNFGVSDGQDIDEVVRLLEKENLSPDVCITPFKSHNTSIASLAPSEPTLQSNKNFTKIPHKILLKMLSVQPVKYQTLVYSKFNDDWWYPGYIADKNPDISFNKIKIHFQDDNIIASVKRHDILRVNLLPLRTKIYYKEDGDYYHGEIEDYCLIGGDSFEKNAGYLVKSLENEEVVKVLRKNSCLDEEVGFGLREQFKIISTPLTPTKSGVLLENIVENRTRTNRSSRNSDIGMNEADKLKRQTKRRRTSHQLFGDAENVDTGDHGHTITFGSKPKSRPRRRSKMFPENNTLTTIEELSR